MGSECNVYQACSDSKAIPLTYPLLAIMFASLPRDLAEHVQLAEGYSPLIAFFSLKNFLPNSIRPLYGPSISRVFELF